jgi:hypothetical protein
MAAFRYYLLDNENSILTADFLDSTDLKAAIVETYRRTVDQSFGQTARGFEVWRDTRLLHQERLETRSRVAAEVC